MVFLPLELLFVCRALLQSYLRDNVQRLMFFFFINMQKEWF